MGNFTLDPCEDFYQFTCSAMPISQESSFSTASTRNIIKMAEKINDPTYRNSNVPKPVKQLFAYFDACKQALQDWSAITNNADYVRSKMLQFQQATQLSFPLLNQIEADPTMPDKTALARAIGYLDSVLQTGTLITSLIDTDWKNPHSTQGYIVMIDQSSLVYPLSYYLKAWNLIASKYRRTVISWMNYLQPGLNQGRLAQDVDDMIALELDIAYNLMTDDTTRRKFARSYNRYSTSKASQDFPFLDWPVYLRQLSTYAPSDVQARMRRTDFEFLIAEPTVLAKLGSYLSSGRYSARTIVNYLNFRVIDTFSSYLPSIPGATQQKSPMEFDVSARRREPRSIIRPLPEWKALTSYDTRCASSTIGALPYANARVLLDTMYPMQNDRIVFRQKFADFMESVLIAFRSMVDHLSWMSIKSKEGAYSKIDDLTKNVAYPDFITDDKLLTQYYAALDIEVDDSYITMREKLFKFNQRTLLEQLSAGPAKRDDFSGSPGTVNAWYQPAVNSITFPLGILQQPFYDPKWPSSMNYGAMGVVVGHELTHGFDDQGIQWDGTGVLYQWMDNSSLASFEAMAQCVITEYGNFCPLPPTYTPSCLDGYNTQGENIADNGGIHAAYRAFKNYENLNGPDPLLNDPIMRQFTPDQLFFLGFAQVWCQIQPSDFSIFTQILTDPHSPALYRVFGTIQNFPAFRAAFNCPLNSKYAPQEHCDVWVTDVEGSHGIPSPPDEENALNVAPPPQVSPAQQSKHQAYADSVTLFKASMNFSADPCNNFYEYVCGNYDQLLSFRKGRLANYRAMSYQMELPTYDSAQTPSAIKKTIQYYKTCKEVRANFEQYISDGAVVLKALNDFQTTTGLTFSMVYNQTSQTAQILDKITLAKAVGYLSSQGIDTLISTMVDTNWTHPQHYSFFADQNVLYYSKTYYSTTAWPSTYRSYKENTVDLFNQFASLIKVTLDQNKLSTDVDALLHFEMTLARQYSTGDTLRRQYKRSYNPFTVASANAAFPFIDFSTYFTYLSTTYPALVNYFNAANRAFLVMEPAMIMKLSNDFSTFDSNMVANYFFYRILAANSEYLPKPSEYRAKRVVSDQLILGRRRRGRTYRKSMTADYSEPTVQCAYETLNMMQYANARIFVDYSYPNRAAVDKIRLQVGAITENIVLSMRGMLNRLDWMDSQSKRGAYSKVTDLVENIAFPDFILNNTQLDAYYEDLVYADSDTYFDLIKKTDEFNFKLFYKLLVTEATVDRHDFGGPPGTVNAWYYPEYNSITFPAGVLHQPFFDENWPASLNYGALGTVAGHELVHGFDDEGVQWSGVGELVDWMTEQSAAGFQNMADCVVNEYNRFCPLVGTGKIPECVNGEQTQGENIADNGGIHSAWRAYQDHVSQYGPDPHLPDPVFKGFTHDQLFFMSFAQIWCEEPRTIEAQYTQIMTDPHSPAKYRVFGTIQNFPAFRTAFNCPAGSAYGPENHCSVWVPQGSSSAPSFTTTPSPVLPTVAHYTNAPISANDPRSAQFAQAADLFRSTIDFTIDPCDNFYNYTCGKFNPSTTMTSFYRANEINIDTMVKKLNDPAYRNSDVPEPVKQLFTFFDECKWAHANWITATANNTYPMTKLQQFQLATTLSFPLLEQSLADPPMPNKTILSKAMGYLDGVLRTPTFITSFIDTNWKDPHSTQGYTLLIDQSTLYYQLSVYRKAWDHLNYREKARAWMNQLKAGLNQETLARDIDDMLALEVEIARNISTDDTTRRKFARSYNRYSISEASQEFTFIDWEEYLRQLSTYADTSVRKQILAPNFKFMIMEPDILHQLGDYLASGRVSSRTVVNYLNFRVITTYSSFLSPVSYNRDKLYELLPADFDVRARRRGPRTIIRPVSRQRVIGIYDGECASQTVDALQYANARVFIDAIYPMASERATLRQNLADFIESVLIGFRSMIDELEWMSLRSKSAAYEKIEDITRNIAYPDFIVDDTLLSKYYAALDISSTDSYTTMLEKIFRFNQRTEFAKLIQGAAERNDFLGPPCTVNAWYEPSLNSITFPAGVLQQPFYDPKWPAAVNYGAMGVVVGHELTHGFDDQGIQWDSTGILYQWMDNTSYISFEQMAQCVIDQYGGFCPLSGSSEPNCLDGSNTQGENIADNGGIHAAYRAFKNYESLNGPDPLLNDPIMRQFTSDQLFFMSFAQMWCQATPTPDSYLESILLDPHSPSLYRVLGTIQNFPAFRSAFNCPLNSTYAPEDHCDVWVTPIKGTYGIPEPPRTENALNILSASKISPAEEAKHRAYSESVEFFKQSVNLSADPCNDFYGYACGNHHQLLSFRKGRLASYRAMSYQMELPMYNEAQTPTALKKTIQYYETCKATRANFDYHIRNGTVVLNALEAFEKQTGLKFSMVYSQASQSPQSLDKVVLGKAVGYLSSQGIDTLISTMVDTDWKNPDHFSFFMDQNALYYSKTYYSPTAWPTTVRSYKPNTIDLFNQFASLVKVNLDQEKLSSDVDALLEFERALAQDYSTDDTARRQYSRSYNPYKIENASSAFAFIDLPGYFTALSTTYTQLDTYFKDPNCVFFVMEPTMIGKLSQDFEKFDSNLIANYFFYRILAQNNEYLPKPLGYKARTVVSNQPMLGRRRRGQTFKKDLTAAYDEPNVQCAYETVSMMQYANARIFVDYSYPNAAAVERIRTHVGGIIENILLSFRGMINRLDWMDDSTKVGAYGKITDLTQNIAFPDFILNNTQLDAYYADLSYATDDSYFDLIRKTDEFNFKLTYKVLVENAAVDRNDFGGAPSAVNAWYYPEYNSITFPAGILQQPFFDENWPASLNYGGLGLVAGHELTHGFDDQGVQWNGVGALIDWMTNESAAGFNNMAQCVIDEYDAFCPLQGSGKMPECVNGEQTQGENIADNGGAQAAWRAYQDYVSQNGPDPQLPDPMYGDFTHDQLFFMGFAQVWCEEPRTIDAQYTQIMTDPHSPSKYRVFGTIQNLPAFRTAFNCPLGSAYGPRKHCNVWVPQDNSQS
uniref:Neprilysin-1 n=1 Tax=Ascaris suum TaxID=6253 RepID=F1KPL9_ASCSU